MIHAMTMLKAGVLNFVQVCAGYIISIVSRM